MKVTIKEVAKLAGVSPSTVSRVISDSSRISYETKRVVRKAMKELGYHPNAIARSLVNKSTNTIGVVMPQSAERALLNPFTSQALSGISAAAHEEGYCLLLSTGNSEKEQVESIEDIVTGGRVDGVILMYSSVDNAALNVVESLNTPAMVIGKPLNSKEVLYVDNDNVEAAYRVTEELIKNGHKTIAFLSGPFQFVVFLDRLDGYTAALSEYNINFDRTYVFGGELTKDSGYEKMKEFLKLKLKPTAVVIADDVMAFGAIEAIKEAGLRIPEDIEIIGFNNIPLAEFCDPSLTSVDIDAYSLGYEASRLIIEKVKGTASKNRVIVPTKVIYRDTTKKR